MFVILQNHFVVVAICFAIKFYLIAADVVKVDQLIGARIAHIVVVVVVDMIGKMYSCVVERADVGTARAIDVVHRAGVGLRGTAQTLRELVVAAREAGSAAERRVVLKQRGAVAATAADDARRRGARVAALAVAVALTVAGQSDRARTALFNSQPDVDRLVAHRLRRIGVQTPASLAQLLLFRCVHYLIFSNKFHWQSHVCQVHMI